MSGEQLTSDVPRIVLDEAALKRIEELREEAPDLILAGKASPTPEAFIASEKLRKAYIEMLRRELRDAPLDKKRTLAEAATHFITTLDRQIAMVEDARRNTHAWAERTIKGLDVAAVSSLLTALYADLKFFSGPGLLTSLGMAFAGALVAARVSIATTGRVQADALALRFDRVFRDMRQDLLDAVRPPDL